MLTNNSLSKKFNNNKTYKIIKNIVKKLRNYYYHKQQF